MKILGNHGRLPGSLDLKRGDKIGGRIDDKLVVTLRDSLHAKIGGRVFGSLGFSLYFQLGRRLRERVKEL